MPTTRLDAALERFLKATRDDWIPLHIAADRKIPAIQMAFMNAVLQAQKRIDLQALAKAILRRDYVAAEAAIDWAAFQSDLMLGLRPVLMSLIRAGALASVTTLERPVVLRVLEGGKRPDPEPEPTARLTMNFNLTNPHAVNWVDTRAGNTVAEVTHETRLAVREVMSRAFVEGMHPYVAAREIRQTVGLTQRGETAVTNYRAQLDRLAQRKTLADLPASIRERLQRGGLRSNQFDSLARTGLTPEKIDKLVDGYRSRLIRERSKMIARTETITASTQGRLALWAQAADQGFLTPSRTQVRWTITPGERTCKNCQQMIGSRAIVPYGSLFDTPLGMMAGPPMHPACRCAISLGFSDS